MAACPAGHAIAHVRARGRLNPGRVVGSADRADESRWRPALGALARPAGPRLAGGGQFLLHGLSVSRAPDLGSPLAADRGKLAALASQQMAGGGSARAIPVGLRGVQSLGQPVVDSVARAEL